METCPWHVQGLTPQAEEQEVELRRCFLDFLRGVLQLDPHTRWTPRQAAMHPFVSGVFARKRPSASQSNMLGCHVAWQPVLRQQSCTLGMYLCHQFASPQSDRSSRYHYQRLLTACNMRCFTRRCLPVRCRASIHCTLPARPRPSYPDCASATAPHQWFPLECGRQQCSQHRGILFYPHQHRSPSCCWLGECGTAAGHPPSGSTASKAGAAAAAALSGRYNVVQPSLLSRARSPQSRTVAFNCCTA